jgi:hypothetical protein
LRGKLDAARKHWATKHQSPFPTALPLELGEHQRVLLLRQLLTVATDAGFDSAELRVQSKDGSQLVRLKLCSLDCQDDWLKRKLLHVSAAPKNQYLLTWRENDIVLSMPYKEVFASPPTDLDLPAFLSQKIDREWVLGGTHRAASDPTKDIAILHLDDALTLDELLVVTNAVATPKRKYTVDGKVIEVPAFELFVY